MLKIETTRMDPKIEIPLCSLRKIMLVCAFYKLEVPFIPSRRAAEIL
jgi:hypothetical protein